MQLPAFMSVNEINKAGFIQKHTDALAWQGKRVCTVYARRGNRAVYVKRTGGRGEREPIRGERRCPGRTAAVREEAANARAALSAKVSRS